MEIICKDEKELPEIAFRIIQAYPKERVFIFSGSMAAGKTTLIKHLCAALGSTDNVGSPTFSLVNEYHTHTDKKIFHFDFYRIEKEQEAFDMGFEEYIYSGNYCFIEWPEKIHNLLPEKYVRVVIFAEEGTRTIKITEV